jgi:hypothetical protein
VSRFDLAEGDTILLSEVETFLGELKLIVRVLLGREFEFTPS